MPYKPTGKPRGRPKGTKVGPVFARVQRARAALQAHAEDYVRLHKQAATVAARKGNSQPTQWALEHIAIVENGKEIRPIGSGVDRQQLDSGSKGPTINIGWIAAPGATQSLPDANVIDVLALPEHRPEE